MKIHVLCNDGSPLGVMPGDIYGQIDRIGIGGAELALMTMCEAWAKRGDEVVLYNNPRLPPSELFEQRPIMAFDSRNSRDVLVVFRSPNMRAMNATGKRVWWSCDQYTSGNFKEFQLFVHDIVCISPFHQKYFLDTYGISNTKCIDIPVRTWDYEDKHVTKVPYRFLFSSVPDRGLELLAGMWDSIRARYPQATLHITSDYRLWGASGPLNERHRMNFVGKSGVKFLGAIPRLALIQEQLEAEVMVYPCIYDELFCIAVAEAQIAGVYPITTGFGALRTTNMAGMFPLDPRRNDGWHGQVFSQLEELYATPTSMTLKAVDMYTRAYERFNISTILKQWDDQIFNKG